MGQQFVGSARVREIYGILRFLEDVVGRMPGGVIINGKDHVSVENEERFLKYASAVANNDSFWESVPVALRPSAQEVENFKTQLENATSPIRSYFFEPGPSRELQTLRQKMVDEFAIGSTRHRVREILLSRLKENN